MIHGLNDYSDIIESILKQFKLEEYKNLKVSTLSGGNKRKLSIALAVLHNPQIILFDEPTSSLDPKARQEVWTMLKTLKQNYKNSLLILTSHHLEEAEYLADKIIVLAKGRVFTEGSLNEIKNKF